MTILVNETIEQIAPVFEMAYGKSEVRITFANATFALRCYENYNCADLGPATGIFIRQQLTSISARNVFPLLKCLEEFGTEAALSHCLNWIATHLDEFVRGGWELDSMASTQKSQLLVQMRDLIAQTSECQFCNWAIGTCCGHSTCGARRTRCTFFESPDPEYLVLQAQTPHEDDTEDEDPVTIFQ